MTPKEIEAWQKWHNALEELENRRWEAKEKIDADFNKDRKKLVDKFYKEIK